MKAAALASAFGLDGMEMLRADDDIEPIVMAAVSVEAAKIAQRRDRARAELIAEAVVKRFK